MRKAAVLLLSLLLVAGPVRPVRAGGPAPALAELTDAAGRRVGLAVFSPADGGVRIRVEAEGLAPGAHGIHIHEAGRCDPPDFLSAGPHFNPSGRRHGLLNPEGPHAGDLPNLVAGPDGRAAYEAVAPLVGLEPGPAGILGRALVVHAGPDDYLTDPAGNSGPRVACGVISGPRPLARGRALMERGLLTVSFELENPLTVDLAEVYLALSVPAGVEGVEPSPPPAGSWFAGLSGGVAGWVIDRIPAGGRLGPFGFGGRVVGPTPGPVRAWAHWRNPAEGTGLLALAGPYPAGLPAGLVRLSGVVPRMGEHWARPGDLPLGPVYGIYGGRLVFIEYALSAADLARGLERSGLPGTGDFGPVDHVEVSCGAEEESDMGPMTESHGESDMGPTAEPHCDIHLFLISPQERAGIRP